MMGVELWPCYGSNRWGSGATKPRVMALHTAHCTLHTAWWTFDSTLHTAQCTMQCILINCTAEHFSWFQNSRAQVSAEGGFEVRPDHTGYCCDVHVIYTTVQTRQHILYIHIYKFIITYIYLRICVYVLCCTARAYHTSAQVVWLFSTVCFQMCTLKSIAAHISTGCYDFHAPCSRAVTSSGGLTSPETNPS